ncbi:MAG: hypothetical protein ABW146_17205 [Candidatus Sedimenticola sp. 6PFRAG7]
MDDVNTRRNFLGKMALLASGITASASPANALTIQGGASSSQIITVGVGGDVASLSEALSQAVSPTPGNQYVISLLPGVHPLYDSLVIPQFVSLIGAGKHVSVIDCMGKWTGLRFSGSQNMADFSIRATSSSPFSRKGVLVNNGSVQDFNLESVAIYLKGGYGAAIFCNGFSTLHLRSVEIWTTSTGIKATGYVYLTDCQVRLTGDATGTPYYGLTCHSSSHASVRYYVTGGFYGTGYGSTREPGFGAAGNKVVNDGNQPIAVFFIPEEHLKPTLTGTRFNLTGVECFALNEDIFDENTPCNCVRVDGAGIIRIFAGIYQAETPNRGTRSWAVVNNNFGTHTTFGNVETYSTRVSSQQGNLTSFSQEAVAQLTVLDDGIQLTKYYCSNYFCDASSGNLTVRLPAVWENGGPPQGSKLRFTKTDNSLNAVTILVSDNVSTIEGRKSVTLSKQYEKILLLFGPGGDDTWYIV